MSETYDAIYYATHCGPIPYTPDAPEWMAFFDHVAAKIVSTLDVRIALDVGCAYGHLVRALNVLDVSTLGMDISDYAIRNSVSPGYVSKRSILDAPILFQNDLVVCIEVVEHLMPEDADTAIEHLCMMSGQYILFSSSPDDFAEPTHHNVQPEEYWLNLFEINGFAKIDTAPWLSPQAIILERF